MRSGAFFNDTRVSGSIPVLGSTKCHLTHPMAGAPSRVVNVGSVMSLVPFENLLRWMCQVFENYESSFFIASIDWQFEYIWNHLNTFDTWGDLQVDEACVGPPGTKVLFWLTGVGVLAAKVQSTIDEDVSFNFVWSCYVYTLLQHVKAPLPQQTAPWQLDHVNVKCPRFSLPPPPLFWCVCVCVSLCARVWEGKYLWRIHEYLWILECFWPLSVRVILTNLPYDNGACVATRTLCRWPQPSWSHHLV